MDDLPCTKPWHHEARRLSREGLNCVQVAAAVGRSVSVVQRFLNPYSARKNAEATNAWQRREYARNLEFRARKNRQSTESYRKRKADPEYARRQAEKAAQRERERRRTDPEYRARRNRQLRAQRAAARAASEDLTAAD